MTAPSGGRDGRRPRPRWSRRVRWTILLVVIGLLVANFWISSRALSPTPPRSIPYSPTFLDQVTSGNVSRITASGSALQGTFRQPIRYPPGASAPEFRRFSTLLPSFVDDAALSLRLQRARVTVDVQRVQGPPLLERIVLGFGPTLLFILLMFSIVRRLSRLTGSGGVMSFGHSRARRSDGGDRPVTFHDVAGIDEATQELTEIVDFLRRPDKYLRLGGKIPRGVLLSGPPGTGKTLLARAVAGEAGVPFFEMSASEFVEMIVGVGASRVRDLFAQAKREAPAIIFVDELDAVAKSRAAAGPNVSGGHDEREQTLNQILTEMDGFDVRAGVIVLAATNRPEILDPALLRPGRFDRHVAVQPPDRSGREAILRVHTRSVPLAAGVNLGDLAASTPGMVGADLANLVNEAALIAARRSRDAVTSHDLGASLERIVLGAERRVMLSEEDRRRTAYHEAGHAIVGMLTPGADPVRKVSIIPRGQALGVTFSAPDADRFNLDERYLLAQIKVALGGRVAEELVFGDRTTGAESDIQLLTRIARRMVGRWGMSPMGPIALLPVEGQSFLLPGVSETSEMTQRRVDKEVARIVDAAHAEVTELLAVHRSRLDALAHHLLEHETLDEAAAYQAAGMSDERTAVRSNGRVAPA